jgi:hypothetical protein
MYLRLATAFILASLAIGVHAASSDAENPCVQGNPTSVQDVQGDTWLATVTAFHSDPANAGRTVLEFRIRHVYAGSDADLQVGRTITVTSGPCFRIARLQPGVDYLFSTPGFSSGVYRSIVFAAWRIEGGAAQFVVMHPDPDLRQPVVLEAATTLEAAVKLVAPDAVLPPTSTAAAGPPLSSPATAQMVLPAVIALLAAIFVTLLLRRRMHEI